MKKFMGALVAVLLAVGGAVVIGAPASAHTPSISADCTGVTVKATAYDGRKANRWYVNIGGVVQSGEFGASFHRTFEVPQDGAVTTWSASVAAFDGAYKQERSGTVGPCGTVPVTTPQIQDYVTCDSVAFVLDNTGSNRGVTYTINGVAYPVAAGAAPHVSPTLASSYVITAADRTWTFAGKAYQTADPNGECFNRPEAPEPTPAKVTYGDWIGEFQCGDTQLFETRQVTTITYTPVWNEATATYEQVPSEPKVETEDRIRDLTAEEIASIDCPVEVPPTTVAPYPPTYDCGDAVNVPTDVEGVDYKATSGTVTEDGVTYTTVTVTAFAQDGYVLADDSPRQWEFVLTDCPVTPPSGEEPPAITPPAIAPPTVAPPTVTPVKPTPAKVVDVPSPPETLAATGAGSNGLTILAIGGLLFVGIVLLIIAFRSRKH